MMGTQFVKLKARRMSHGAMREDEDRFGVYLYDTSERRRYEDERRAVATQHFNPEAHKRKMIYVGTRFDSLARPTATQRCVAI